MPISISNISRAVGSSGYSGPSGFSGWSGVSGFSGRSGWSGFSGSGVSGFSGWSGISGFSGWSGISGFSGWSGISGFSGWSGISGFSGWSGISGFSGWSGISGWSGFSGSGVSGWSGFSGQSGYFAQALTFSTAGSGNTDSYNGTAAKTISHNSVGALALSGGTLTGELTSSISGSYGSLRGVDQYHRLLLRGTPSDATGGVTAGDQMSFIEYGGEWRWYRTNGTVNRLALTLSADTSTYTYYVWPAAGVAAPATTTRSAGTKLVLYPEVGASTVDYAMGIESSTLWFSVPQTTSRQFRWYAGTTEVAKLQGDGKFYLYNTNGSYLYGDGAGLATTGGSYFYVNNTMYVQNGIIARGGLSNDGGDLALNDNVNITGNTTSTGFYITADTNNRFVQGGLVLRNANPTIYFRDTDQNSAMIHVNSNIFYILRGGNDTETWTSVGSGWPLEINLTNNNAQFSGNLTTLNDLIVGGVSEGNAWHRIRVETGGMLAQGTSTTAGIGAYSDGSNHNLFAYNYGGSAYNTLNIDASTLRYRNDGSTVITTFNSTGLTMSSSRIISDFNIASPSNYYNGLQVEIRATSGTAGIGLHRSGYSHVGIYHDTINTLSFNMSSGTVTMKHDAGVLWGSGNDGAGTGLDADLLDGQHGSYYQQNFSNVSIVELNGGGSGNRYAGIDFVGDSTYTDYGFRILRGNSGANAGTFLYHRGTGNFDISCSEAAYIIFYTSGTERGSWSSNGLELSRIDTSNEGAQIAWKRASDNSIKWYTDLYANDWRVFNSGGTGVYLIDGQQSWSALSDERLKYDIEPIENALDKLSGVRWVTYRLKKQDQPDSKKRFGTIAQDLIGKMDEVLSMSTKGKTGEQYYGVAYSDMIPVLAAAILELKKEIETLKGN